MFLRVFVRTFVQMNVQLAIAWNWEFDEDFLTALERECESRGLSTIRIDPPSLPDIFQQISDGSLTIEVLFDRASDSDERFLPLISLLQQRYTRILNGYSFAERSRDKATMHLEFLSEGLLVPYTLILPSFQAQPFLVLSEDDLNILGRPFVIKPANTTGGGVGVNLDGQSLADVAQARQEFPRDKYLVQERIVPTQLNEKRAWFRVFYALGEVIPCWWNDHTHIYREVTLEEETEYRLTPLRNYLHAIHHVCQLEFFSSEIVLTKEGKFIVVDYVNEVCDMRLQSRTEDGVPDAIVVRIVSLLVNEVVLTLHRSQLLD